MRLFAIALLVTLAGCAPIPTATATPTPATNPCLDERYRELLEMPVDDMTEREYEYFLLRDRACTEYQQTEPQRQAAAGVDTIVLGTLFLSFVSGLIYWLAMTQ